ncbi:Mitochondrial rho gtpase [Thalictrum thalictroides]|uniref:Mitochondrial rho gtpase n=1 Tax=Thalictrum thalictroides TaxID=46969 RepID=A0A7J6V649_THATH|nr:Mitochondrial rho gtpase [Thalictrum thalictroides]
MLKWSLMTLLLEPARSLENLIYVNYPGNLAPALHITMRRQVDRKKQQSERNVYQCFVFGPKKPGKSALLYSFLGRQFTKTYASDSFLAANVVVYPDGTMKTLILGELPEDKIPAPLSCKESLAGCDLAVFVHDSSNELNYCGKEHRKCYLMLLVTVKRVMLFDVASLINSLTPSLYADSLRSNIFIHVLYIGCDIL